MLPAYCADAMLGPKGYGGQGMNPAAGHWVPILGEAFWSIHHYCNAQFLSMRSENFKLSAEQRQRMREVILGEYDYVLKKGSDDFILRPELLTKKGNVLVRLRRDDEAIRAYRQAAAEKPDYWPAYAGLAELYRARGNYTEAGSVLEAGLKTSPDSKVLRSLQEELRKAIARAPASKGVRSERTPEAAKPPNTRAESVQERSTPN